MAPTQKQRDTPAQLLCMYSVDCLDRINDALDGYQHSMLSIKNV